MPLETTSYRSRQDCRRKLSKKGNQIGSETCRAQVFCPEVGGVDISLFGDGCLRSPSGNALAPKEIQIGILVRRCLRNRDIAETLGISEQVVKNRLRGIFDKVAVLVPG
jgi:DNA-binding NarL/FixJ family response regulator